MPDSQGDGAMPKSLYGEVRRGVPQVVFWKGEIKPDGTPGEDYVEITFPVKDVEELLETMKKA